jgi:ATP-binding cassette, subfamily F, member 3
MILSCQNISKSFGTDEILKNVSFHIEENEKAAVVGINGAGKSTLLKIIMKQENPDERVALILPVQHVLSHHRSSLRSAY